MTGYELVFITTPTLSEDDLAVVLKNLKEPHRIWRKTNS